MTQLTCTGGGISDLTGLEYAVNLTHLDLSGNQIRDISALQGLKMLEVLNLRGNPLNQDAYVTYLRVLETNNPGLDLSHDITLIAWSPEPADKAVGVTLPVLRWKAGRTAVAHDVYLGQHANLSGRNLRGRQTTTSHVPRGAFTPGTTYYWRIDEVEANGAVHQGEVWSFTISDPRLLTVSASPGGSVLTPSDGQFPFEKGTVLGIEAAPGQADYEFLTWSGTAVDSGKVADPNAAATTVLVNAEYTLEALFAERVEGPTLGFSLGDVDMDDPQQFDYRVSTNSTTEATFVERVLGIDPDPNGMMQMQVIEGQAALAMTRFGQYTAPRLLVRFTYLFGRAAAGLELVAYLSDRPTLLALEDPNRQQHYQEVGRVVIPPEDCPGAVGSGRFAVFQEWVSTEGMDLGDGTWLVLELVQRGASVQMASAGHKGLRLASGEILGGLVYVDQEDLQNSCTSIVCMDIDTDGDVTEEDFLLVWCASGCPMGLPADGQVPYCFDGLFSSDGYADAYDVGSWDWILKWVSQCKDCTSYCIDLPLVREGAEAQASSDAASIAASSLPEGLLVLGKKSIAGVLADGFYGFGPDGTFSDEYPQEGVAARCNLRLVQSPSDQLYMVNSETGVVQISGTVKTVIPPGQLTIPKEPRHDTSARIYIGIQGVAPSVWGRPILDVAFDGAGYAYVAPVVVKSSGHAPYAAAAKLHLLDGSDPPYAVVQLFADRPQPGDNRDRDTIREIEVDGSGNVYVLNAHADNESDMLWKYGPDGTVLERLVFLSPNSPARVIDPLALHVSRDDKTLYVASGQLCAAHPNESVIYGLSTQDLSSQRTITITGMPQVVGITETPQGVLHVAGFGIEGEPSMLAPFTACYLATIPVGVDHVEATRVSNWTCDLALPMSVVFVGIARQ